MEYTVKLEQFEGPLDLLLHLVGKAKIDLQDIFVSKITEQYLAYMEQLDGIDMDRASEFLNMAATLLYIKSRSLLPPRRSEQEDEDFIDPETELIERLRAYKLYKEMEQRLSDLEKDADRIYYKLPEEMLDAGQEIIIEDASADALYLAFLEVLKSRKKFADKEPEKKVEIKQDTFSIRMQRKAILSRLKREKKFSFSSLFEEQVSAMEVAVTFVALLELWHISKVAVRQTRAFGEIHLEYTGEGE
ncbi:MAG: segregation/condensation protein A [Christensenella sp.]|nr:segregation/condensation protein A [Christensenella sp.]